MQKKLTEQGLKYLEAGQFKKAGQILSLLVKSFPENPEAHHMLGIIELESGNFAIAENLVQAAIRLEPNNPMFYNTLGNIEVRNRKYKQAEAAFLAAIQFAPNKIEYKYNLAHFYLGQGQYQKAIDFYYYILQENPTHYLSIRGITVSYLFSGEPQIALEHAREWINEFSIYDEPYYYLGLCNYATNNISAALKAYDQGLALNPNNHEILIAISACYKALGNFSIAETYLLKSLNIESNNPAALYNLGCINLEQGKLDVAKKNFMNANSLDKNYVDPICSLAQLELINANIDQALKLFDRAQQMEPFNTKPLLGKATTLLRSQCFKEGWQQYRNAFTIPNALANIPSWSGELLNGQQTLLVWVPKEHYELSQQIMFFSILSDLQQKIPNVLILCEAKLIPLLAASFATFTFVDEINFFDLPQQIQSIDYQIPLNALGQIFRTSVNDFSKPKQGYLKYDLKRKNHYSEKYQQLFNNKKLIGIAWRATEQNLAVDHLRSLKINDLMPLLNKNNCQFINLQPNHPISEVASVYVDPEANITELAAQMASLDLIVSVDNGIAHLAGALGLNVFTLIPAYDRWYWFGESQRSLWYPSMRILKQSNLHNWKSIIKQLTKIISQ